VEGFGLINSGSEGDMAVLPDQFGDDVRSVVRLAEEDAQRRGLSYVGPEHLLLGLLRADEAAGARILRELADLDRVRRAVEFVVGDHGGASRDGDRTATLTPRASRVIGFAGDEARSCGHHVVGSDHLVLGLIREGEGIPAVVLASFGVRDLAALRGRVTASHGPTDAP
jgi:ATP-dependent Clp protease ATP-binding subunit ClpC